MSVVKMGGKWNLSAVILLLGLSIHSSNTFFFSPLFGRQSTSTPTPTPPPKTNREHVVNGGEASEQQPTFQISARLIQSPGGAYALLGDQNLQVPNSLCIACGKFPWTPVALAAVGQATSSSEPQPTKRLPQTQAQQQGQEQQQPISFPQPAPTILQNSQRDGNRQPFAIQFGSSQTKNVVSLPPGQASSKTPARQQYGPVQAQASQQPSILQPMRLGTVWHPTSRPAQFYGTAAAASSPEKQSQLFSTTTRSVPTETVPAKVNTSVQYVFLPPQLPRQQPPTVLQPVRNHGPRPTSIHEIAMPSSQLAKLKPAASQAPVALTQQDNKKGGASLLFPNKQSNIQAPPVGALGGAKQQSLGGFEIQGVQPARLIHQEHTKVLGSTGDHRQNQNSESQPRPFTPQTPNPQLPPQQHPENIKVPIIPRPLGTLTISKIRPENAPSRFQSQTQSFPQNGNSHLPSKEKSTKQFELPPQKLFMQPPPPLNQQYNGQPLQPLPFLPFQQHGQQSLAINQFGPAQQQHQQIGPLPQEAQFRLPHSLSEQFTLRFPTSHRFLLPQLNQFEASSEPQNSSPPPQLPNFPPPPQRFNGFPPQILDGLPLPQLHMSPPPQQQLFDQGPLNQQHHGLNGLSIQQQQIFQNGPPPQQQPIFQNGPIPQEQQIFQNGPPPQQQPIFQNGPPPQQQQIFQNGPPPQQQPIFQNGPPPQQQQIFQNGPPPQQQPIFQNGPPPQQQQNFQNGPPPQQQQNLQNGSPPQLQQNLHNGPPPQQQQNLQNGPPPQQQQNVSLPQQQQPGAPPQLPLHKIIPALQLTSFIQQQTGPPPPPPRNQNGQAFQIETSQSEPQFNVPQEPQQQVVQRPYHLQYFGPVPPQQNQFGSGPFQQEQFGPNQPPQQQFIFQNGPSFESPNQLQGLSLHMLPPPSPEGFQFPSSSIRFGTHPFPQPQSFQQEQSATDPNPPNFDQILAEEENPFISDISNESIIPDLSVAEESKKTQESYPFWNVRTENQRKPYIVPIPVPNFIGPDSHSEDIQSTNVNFYPSPQKINFSPLVTQKNDTIKITAGKGSYLESIGPSDQDGSEKETFPILRPEQPKLLGLQGGWEIIPATQYDITHLFDDNNKQSGDTDMPPVPYHIPVPVPFTIPASPPTKPSLFVVSQQSGDQALAGAPLNVVQQHIDHIIEPPQPEEPHKDDEKPEEEPPQSQISTLSTNESEERIPYVNPQPISIPIVQTAYAQPQSQTMQFNQHQLTPSIVTALHHAQRTSFLTHSHLVGQSPDGNKQEVMYVNSVPVRDNGISSGSSQIDSIATAPQNADGQAFYGAHNTNAEQDQLPVGCKHGQWMVPLVVKPQEHVEASASKIPFLLYYPTPVQQSSVYWVEQPMSQFDSSIHQPISTLSPSESSYGFKEPFSPEAVFSPPVFGWSPKIVQTSNALTESADTVSEQVSGETNYFRQQQQSSSTSTKGPLEAASFSQETLDSDSIQSLETSEITTTPAVTTIKPLPTKSIRFYTSRPVTTPGPGERFSLNTLRSTTSAAAVEERKLPRPYGRPKSPKLVSDTASQDNIYTEVSGPTTTADCITDSTTEIPVLSSSTQTVLRTTQAFNYPRSSTIQSSTTSKTSFPDKIRLKVGSRFPAGRPAISSSFATTTPVSPATVTVVPIYRPLSAQGDLVEKSSSVATVSATATPAPPNYLLTLEDIYKNSEAKHSQESKERLSTSTDHMPSFSVSMDTSSMSTSVSSSFGQRGNGTSRKLYRPDEAELGSETLLQSVTATTTPIPSFYSHVTGFDRTYLASSQSESDSNALHISTSTEPTAMVTKVVKTVRVRQRLRPGGSSSGPIRSRIAHSGRVRVVQRPVTPEYIKNFPEFSVPEGEALGKEEQEEVKNALIDLKKIPSNNNSSQ